MIFSLFFFKASSSPTPQTPQEAIETSENTSFDTLRFLENHQIEIPSSMVQNQFGMAALRKLLDVEASQSVYAPGLSLEEMGLTDLPPRGQVINALFYINWYNVLP